MTEITGNLPTTAYILCPYSISWAWIWDLDCTRVNGSLPGVLGRQMRAAAAPPLSAIQRKGTQVTQRVSWPPARPILLVFGAERPRHAPLSPKTTTPRAYLNVTLSSRAADLPIAPSNSTDRLYILPIRRLPRCRSFRSSGSMS